MKITKYLHSCLLVEEGDKTLIIDPGQFTHEAQALDIDSLSHLDYILITHEHFDHYHPPFVKALLQRFPSVQIITNSGVQKKLQSENIRAIQTTPDFINMQTVPHEDIAIAPAPENSMFTLFNKLTDPGDSHHFNSSTKILALPVQAPWGSIIDALKLAVTLKPAHIIPIHDWHWKDEARKQLYAVAENYLKQFDITFHKVETGQTVEIL